MSNPTDQQTIAMLRVHGEEFLAREAASLRSGWPTQPPPLDPPLVLEVGSEGHAYGPRFFPGCRQRTLDINPQLKPDILADLCGPTLYFINQLGLFDVVICTNVLEHTRRPWLACENLWRLLKPGGTALITTPFNCFIHAPSPDCWRFTPDGLSVLLAECGGFSVVGIDALETPGRAGFPIQYTIVAVK